MNRRAIERNFEKHLSGFLHLILAVHVYKDKYRADIYAHTLGVKYFAKIALSHTVFEINVFLHFMQKFKMTVKNGRKMIFGVKSPDDCGYPWGENFCHFTISEMNGGETMTFWKVAR